MSLLRGLLFENVGLKLVALLLALVVYLHVYTDRPATMTVAFPVEITDLADSLAIVTQTPSTVITELKGTGKQLIRLRLLEPRLQISLAGVGPGHFQRSLMVEDLPLGGADGLAVSRFVGPQMVELQIDRVIERAVPVAASLAGNLPPGTAWSGEWLAEPARVTVRGPRSIVLKLDTLWLAPVRVEAGHDTLRAVVGPASLPPGCRISPPSVNLRIPLTRNTR